MYSRFSHRIYTIFSSPRFFYGVMILFVLQALWFALTAVYPMAFDEQYHFGLIQVYATQWSPLFAEAPPGSGAFGALTRDPSYLYYYVMGFPYRLISFFFESETLQIVILRLINIGMFAGGLWLFRHVLHRLHASPALTHFILLMTILIPITPMLAAHINYDNMLFLLVPLVILVTIRLSETMKLHKRIDMAMLLSLLTVCLFASLVKYAFLPVFVAAIGYVIFVFFWHLTSGQRKTCLRSLPRAFGRMHVALKISLVAGVLVTGGLFVERYITNLVQYQMVVPQCERVMDYEFCSEYSVWIRNYNIQQNLPDYVDPNPVRYAALWYYNMNYRLFFAINADYYNRQPLPIPFITALVVGVAGAILFAVYARRILRQHPILWLGIAMVGLYTAILFGRAYVDYLEHGRLLALNGRYFIPLMPIILLFVGLAVRELVARLRHARAWKSSLAVVAVLIFLQGGGVLTYIVRSDFTWYWPQQTVVDAAYHAKKLVGPFILFKDTEVPPSS